jgi:hypothetical protein
VKITDAQGQPLGSVYLALSDAEARELIDALNELIATKQTDWHAHVSDPSFQVEVTVSREDELPHDV